MPQLPVIDGFEFARSGSRQSGDCAAKDFRRLLGALYAPEGTIHYELQGLPQELGRPALRLSVTGRLQLICQRCLGPLQFELRSATQLLLFAEDAELAAVPIEAEGPERIVASRDMSVLDLVEDEVLLAVPYAPRHEQCTTRDGHAPDAPQRPFAGLRALLGGKH
ncbi:MAG: DUF177 domain-containing protein [Betaproteobacteria bacterium]|nr:MAG: DUF177 domain-containing protein [Betaproteobacteria bacterium]